MTLVAGLNSSTQSLSCVVIDLNKQKIVYRDSVNYGHELGEKYGVVNGFMDSGTGWVHAPPLMWVEALDIMCARLEADFGHVNQICAVAGAGQQHGTVYLNKTGRNTLAKLTADTPLIDQIAGIFSRPTSPIWRDGSTGYDCEELARIHGDRFKVAELTGSIPTRRFSGPQIHKFARTEPAAYDATSDIALVSSFVCSLLTGKIAPIDHGDGAGMNLMNIKDLKWLKNAFGSGMPSKKLVAKLPGQPMPTTTVVGPIHDYFAKRYGFNPACKVLIFSGDNPDSLLGMGVYKPGNMVMSFGTSDTNFCMIAEPKHDPNGFANILGAVTGGYMALSCFANGALTRQTIRDRFNLDWSGFSKTLSATPPGNDGKLMIPFLAAEITPTTDGPVERYFNGLAANDCDGCVRAVVEAQFLNMFHFSQWLGDRPTVIRATGGASANRHILQVCADVFNAEVHQCEATDSVSLGAALRAAHTAESDWTWQQLTTTFCKTTGHPILPQNADAYNTARNQFSAYLKQALSS